MQIIRGPEEQPVPPDVSVPFSKGGEALYSRMDLGDLMKLRRFIDALIKWRTDGNPVYIGSVSYLIDAAPDAGGE